MLTILSGIHSGPRNVGTPLRGTPGSQGVPRQLATVGAPWQGLLMLHTHPRDSGSAGCSTLIIVPPTKLIHRSRERASVAAP